ncbi:hypothetical protein [Edaphobacter albus]|uniref:hypothetical protein n=1 Tax=Edaphobacter sp. 4G125 TaxID=2763071 RepID=UPI001645F7DA|nr:hypothetical protein [Edaphobacter sp. 4G125]QNI37316.1 hypothetical protein H7846_03085 [Edaphobacter sp. 4G125]
MEDSLMTGAAPIAKRVAPYIVALVIAGTGIGYAVHEHHSAQSLAAQAQTLEAQNSQVTAQLSATKGQMDALTAKVNALAVSNEAKAAPSVAATTGRPRAAHTASAQDVRFKKLQSQLDAQGKEIEDTRNNLASTSTELTGSIARTHDELVVLEKKGERNYSEFDLQKSKQFQREGPLSISLRKANTKHQYADLQLMVDDRNLSQKHVNLYQPVMFYQPDSQRPVEIIINSITKDHVHGYVSSPKYLQSDLTAMANGGNNSAPATNQAANSNAQPSSRQRLPLPR